MNIEHVIESLDAEISRLQQARAILNSTGTARTTGRGRRRRKMSAAAKAKIAAAQRARWARVKTAQKKK